MIDYTVDNLTVALLAIITALAIYHRFFTTALPTVHPLLLGKQSDVSAVRKDGESGIYRNWATGQGTPFTVRPANSLKTTNDLVPTTVSQAGAVPKCILDVSLSQEALAELIRRFPIGLTSLFNLPTSNVSPRPILVLLPPSPVTALPLLILQLAATPSSPLVILPSPKLLTKALTPAADSHPVPGVLIVHQSLLEDVLEQAVEDCGDSLGIMVVGDNDKSQGPLVERAIGKGMKVHWWEDVWEAAEISLNKITVPTAHFNDVHSYFYKLQEDDEDEVPPEIAKVTHLNITAGVAGVLSIFPPDKRPSAALRDVVASSVRLDTPFGMTIALASIWCGASFRFIGPPVPIWPESKPTESEIQDQLRRLMDTDQPAPTLLFLSSNHAELEVVTRRLKYAFSSHPLASVAAAHKLHAIRAGDVSKSGVAESLVWKPVRGKLFHGLFLDTMRGIVIVGDLPLMSTMVAAQSLLSLPISRVYATHLSTGPIFASHFYDVQSNGVHHTALLKPDKPSGVSEDKEKCHTGPPAANIEVLLKGPNSYVVEGDEGGKIRGSLWVRGPTILERVGGRIVEGWTNVEAQAEVQTNGTFLVDH
ncbi:hypothetical protein BD324DRAFT_609750 [Kockovaella imperatae]|uniref:AMP-dependent synthetase/ligase domain-containing protein n=1 Tax=Kockovaella imperatae TaxID=4999 RepID=A0A1Y1UD78_9TREE|nr:hypothetical protein BD324DRAFT_609750 [Kockovaella imperatae]ORX35025.1 hypothetical protein BD324DRAFT_609750 [Kockovaella imperatae]